MGGRGEGGGGREERREDISTDGRDQGNVAGGGGKGRMGYGLK